MLEPIDLQNRQVEIVSDVLRDLPGIADVVLSPDGFDTAAQEALGEKMSFNPWNAIEAHRPLGNLNRARKIVYSAVYAKRTSLNGKTPFEPEP